MRVVTETVDTAKAVIASPGGRQLRAAIAAGVIVAAPLVLRLPGVRKHPIGRLVVLAGGAAALVKVAETIRDWEPDLGAV